MKLSRKLIALNLAILLTFTILPITALAASEDLGTGSPITFAEPNEDGYTFTPSETGLYTAMFATTVDNAVSFGNLQVYDTNGDELYGVRSIKGNWATYCRTLPLQQGKTYTIKCLQGWAESSQYTLSISKAVCPTLSSTPTRFSGLEYYYDNLFFQYTPTEAGWYTFSTSPGVYLYTYDANFEGIDSGEAGDLGLSLYLKSNQTYYLSASPDTSGTIAVSPASFPALTTARSTTIKLGEAFNYLTFTPTLSGSYTIKAETNNSYGVRYVYIFSDTQEYLAGEWDKEADYSAETTYNFSAGTTYYIGVHGADAENGVVTATYNEAPAGLAQWTTLYPANGATDVGYSGNNPPKFQITFDREIAALASDQPWVANVDLTSEGAFAIYRASDDQLIYKSGKYTTYDHTIAYAPEKSTLQIKPTATSSNNYELKPDTTYYITMGEGFVRFADGSTNPAIVKGEWQFTTGTAEFFSTETSVIIKASDDAPRVPVAVTWDDSWFMNSAAMTYNHELARTSMALSGAAYVEDYDGDPSYESIQSALKQFNFDEIKSYNYSYPLTADDNDHVAYTFAVKRIKHLSDDTTYLVAVVVKGTSGNEEWYSNFNIGTDDTHRGFNLAKIELMKDLEKYLSDLGLTSSYKNSTKFLVTGHSRGAAVANLVAADLSYSSHATASNVYGYTFATPTVSTQAGESGYENIYNIISGEDFVTQVPLSRWGFRHYGIGLLLPSKSYYSSGRYETVYGQMKSKFNEITQKDFEQFKNGTQDVDALKRSVYVLAPSVKAYYADKHDISGTLLFKTTTTNDYFQMLADFIVKGMNFGNVAQFFLSSNQSDFTGITWFFFDNHLLQEMILKIPSRVFSAHSMAGYYSWLRGCSAEELFGSCNTSTSKTFKRLSIACPVDVYVYDTNRTVVASVVDEKIIADTLAVNVENGVKTIDLPNDQEYSIEIVATDEGSVSYTVEELSAEGIGDSTLRTVKFNDIGIDNGDELTGTVNDVMYTDKVNYALTKNDTDTIYADYDSYEQPSVDPIVPVTPTPSYPVGGSVGETVAYTITIPAVAGGVVTATPKSASKGSTVILTVTPDKGYELVSLRVTDNKGNELELTDEGNGKYAFEMPNNKVAVEATFRLISEQGEAQIPQESEAPWANPFADVTASAWYYDAVKFVSENGLMNGISSNLFTPDANLSRAQLAQILYSKEDKPTVSGGSTFTDVATGAWYSDAVTWAATNGIVGGYGNGLFGPDDNITREQFAVMLWRYAGEPAANAEVSFSDTNQISDFALASIRWAVENGILAGKENHTLDPKGCATRAEVAQMLKNYLG